MKLQPQTKVITGSLKAFSIASLTVFSVIPLNIGLSQANPTRSIQASSITSPNLAGQWVLGSMESESKIGQQPGKLGISVTQNGDQLRVQPLIGIPMTGRVSGQQVHVAVPDGQRILGNISNDGNRVLLTLSGTNQGKGVLVRVGSPGCPNRGSWNSTIQGCNIDR